jgi:quinol monooxygenase YgiN
MLIIAGTLQVDPARRDEFISGREEAMRASRAEPGCLAYVFSADSLEPGRVCLFERWESKDHLAAHLEKARSQQPGSAGDPGSVPVLSSELVQYEISAVGPIGS